MEFGSNVLLMEFDYFICSAHGIWLTWTPCLWNFIGSNTWFHLTEFPPIIVFFFNRASYVTLSKIEYLLRFGIICTINFFSLFSSAAIYLLGRKKMYTFQEVLIFYPSFLSICWYFFFLNFDSSHRLVEKTYWYGKMRWKLLRFIDEFHFLHIVTSCYIRM